MDDAAFADFRGLHRRVLGDTSDLALQAFLKFLDRGPPVLIAAAPPFRDRIDPNVIFRFEYDDDFLHNQPAARQICKGLAEGLGAWDPPLAPGYGARRESAWAWGPRRLALRR